MSLIYGTTPSQLVLDLIKAANPALPFALTTTNCKLGIPAAITPAADGIQDTSVRVFPIDRTVYATGITVQYRRIDLAVLFRNMALTIETYNAGTSIPASQLVSEFNSKYGTQLTTDELSQPTYAFGSISVTVNGTSKAYKGTFNLTLTKAKQNLSALLAEGPLTDTLLWPNQQAVVANKPQGEFALYGIDFSGDRATLNALSSGAALPAGGNFAGILSRLNRLYGCKLALTDPTKAQGLLGLIATRFTLPHASVPFANSANYNTVLAISAKADSWFTGRILMHYNT